MLKNNIILWAVLLCLTTMSAQLSAQFAPTLWEDTPERYMHTIQGDRQIIPDRYRTLSLDFENLKTLLEQAPLRFSEEAATTEVILQIPMPNGEMESFSIVDAPIMEPGLASKYPYMHAYAGQGIDDPTASIRFDVTQMGFHAMILSARHSGVFIDPYSTANTEHYISYYKKDFTNGDPFVCEGVRDAEIVNSTTLSPLTGDCVLRTYRLALACTGEYAQYHGGTVAGALAAMNTTMVRVNGVYERDATITMVLIDNTDELIFLNGNTDPYTNSNGGAMLGQNQNEIDNTIGTANYDIGHVFSTGGGGIASLNSPCSSNRKAQGVTGQSNPVGDPFDIDYVSHEMGHQYGGNHTQNNNCNSVSGASVEPGSASTIMGYAGICSPNVQSNSDDHFHIYNLREIAANVTGGISSSCPQETNTGNSAPSANAGSNYTIPKSTPFILTGTGIDSDNDVLLYNWEQMDAQVASMPPQPTNNGGPLFRSNSPIESPSRYMPNLEAVINNNNPTWEVLPGVARTLNFTFSVRDNNMGSGCVADDDMQVQVAGNAGPFLVTSPNTAVSWMAGSTETVTWDVANTNAAPVNAQNVDIMLSTDGGYTFTVVLAENVPNDGSHDIVVPNNEGNNNRVRIMGSNNIFYDMSNTNFTIEAPAEPIFTAQVDNSFFDVCSDGSAEYVVTLAGLGGFTSPVNIALNDLPDGATVAYSDNDIVPDATVTITVSNLQDLAAGGYNMNLVLTGGTQTETIPVAFNLTTASPSVATLLTPANGASNQALAVELTWEEAANAISYAYQVSTSPIFDDNSIVSSGSTSSPNKMIQGLEALTVYYWRVVPTNTCGEAEGQPAVFAFQTGNSGCVTYSGGDLPLPISASNTDIITSSIFVGENVEITSLTMPVLDIQHSWPGDLIASLETPSGSIISLFDRPGVPGSDYGCDGDDINVSFSDDASATSDEFENTCDDSAPSISGAFQPMTPFASVNNENAQGNWILTIEDTYNEDGGALVDWQIEVCFASPEPTAVELTQSTLTVESSTQGDVTTAHLNAQIDGVAANATVFTVLTEVSHGSLVKSGLLLEIGDTFTQSDINNGSIQYVNNGDGATTDAFSFDITGSNGSWTGVHTFNIAIVVDDLDASLALTTPMVCSDDAATLTVSVNGGTAPFMYSLDGTNFQSEPVFQVTAAGEYIATVTDANGFTDTSNPVDVIAPDALTATANIDVNNVTINVTGGTAPYTYSLDGAAAQDANTFEDLADGVYTVTVTDANNCTTTVEVVIAIASLQVTATINSSPLCHDSNEGQITVTVAGGVEPYTYSINGGTAQDSNVFGNLAAGSYTVVVTDAMGMQATTQTLIIEAPTALTLSASANDFEITFTATGGTPSYNYSINGMDVSSPYTAPANGEYTIDVTDANGCTASTSVTITVNTLVIDNVSTTDIACNGGTGSATVTVSGGTTPYTYSIDGENFQDSNIFEGVAAGEYTITVQDAEGFTQTTSIAINEPSALTSSVSVQCNTLFEVIATGGTAPYTYDVVGMDCYPCDNLPNGDYEVITTDDNGCTSSATFTINTIESAIVLSSPVSCHGDSDGTITVSEVQGGEAPYFYMLNNTTQDDPTFTGLAAGIYDVVILDNNECAWTVTATVETPDPFTADITTEANTITITADGGTAPYQYSINDGVDFTNENVFAELENGTYEVVVQDANGCEVTETIVILIDSVDDIEIDVDWSIFPNPSKGLFTLTLNSASTQEVVVDIYDVLGRSVYQNVLLTNVAHQINLSTLSDGAYMLKITSDNASASEQLLIQK